MANLCCGLVTAVRGSCRVKNLDRTPAVTFHPIQAPPNIVVMLVYLDEAYERRAREGRMTTAQDLREAIMEGAVQRVRPKMMTVAAIMGGLLPILRTAGTGADVMKRIAAPMIGGW